MTNFKLLGAAAILSAAIATPALAQEAVQEPGVQAFYQSLGVGSQSKATASAMASTRRSSHTSATGPRQQVSTWSAAIGGPNGPPILFNLRGVPKPIAWATTNRRTKNASQLGADG
jgi:hypothetical protein